MAGGAGMVEEELEVDVTIMVTGRWFGEEVDRGRISSDSDLTKVRIGEGVLPGTPVTVAKSDTEADLW